MKNIFNQIIVLLIAALSLSSCATQNIYIGQGKPLTDNATVVDPLGDWEYSLRSDDKLSISVWQHDDLSVGSIFDIYNSNEVYGRWLMIDVQGNIDVPQLGKIAVGGLTLNQAEKLIAKRLTKFINDPIVVVKVLNREVTVLGEVRTPGNFTLEKERNTLLELIGKAEGFEGYANLKKVSIMRNDEQLVIDLTAMTELQKMNLIVQNGDVIYIPTRRGKVLDKKAPTLIPFASVLTSAAIVTSIFLAR